MFVTNSESSWTILIVWGIRYYSGEVYITCVDRKYVGILMALLSFDAFTVDACSATISVVWFDLNIQGINHTLYDNSVGDQDTDPPTISGCPDDIRVNTPVGVAFTTVMWTEPSATDDSREMPTQTRSHAPGSTFFLGSTRVTYRFTDNSGNSDVCVFDVIVSGKHN